MVVIKAEEPGGQEALWELGGGLGTNKHSILSKAYSDLRSKARGRFGVMECGETRHIGWWVAGLGS